MSKFFNHKRRSGGDQDFHDEKEWEEGENYVEEGEYYTEEGEYYAEEAAGDDGNYVEEGEYYTEEGEYYAEEAARDDGNYVEEGEYYTEEGGYYAEEAAGDNGNYVEEGEYYAGEAENYTEEGEILYEDDELYQIDYIGEESRGAKEKAGGGLLQKLAHMPVMDRVIALTGVAVLLLAVLTGAVFVSSRIVAEQVSDFVSVGTRLDGVEIIGEDALFAVANVEMARFAAAAETEEPDQEEPEDPGYDENAYSRQVTVELTMTSIQKDLKIKFINKKTGKLIANVPFSVMVTDPDGNTSIWSDDDMDGIIYKKDIVSGIYKVSIEKLSDEKYENYTISTGEKTAEVKKDIAYEKVDVANEVKTEAEVDVKKEDTAQKDTAVESALQDTVAWVESTSTGMSYMEVAKSAIPDPLTILTTTAWNLDKSFLRISLVSSPVSISASTRELKVGGTVQMTAGSPNVSGDAGENITSVTVKPGTASWTSLTPAVATVDSSGKVTGVAEGQAVIQYSATAVVTTKDPTVSEGDAAGITKEIPVSGQITVAVQSLLSQGTVTADKTAVSVVIKGTAVVQVSTKNFTAEKAVSYEVLSDKSTVATATVDASGKVTITGVSEGTANITVTANYAEGGTDATAAKTVIAVTVGENKTITLSSNSSLAYVGNPFIVNAVVKGVSTTAPTVTVESSDTTVMTATLGALKAESDTVTAPVTLTPIKVGSATLTVKCLENGEEVNAACVVTVKTNPREDRETPLKDAQGNLLYVLENKKYRQAVYADYYTFEKFYIQGDMKYTGWQTLGGHVYYYTAEGRAVTGEQVIQGAKYTFASDGSLVTGNGALGIDVSKWNGSIDWSAVKNSGINYVIIRCGYRGSSQGALIEDPKFQNNIKGATAAGLKVGVYFFTQAVDEREAVEEASMVLGLIKNYRISYPVFLDVESSGGRADSISKEMRTAVCKAFCETIRKEGYTAGIYANKTWLEKKMDASALSAYKIWLAQYAETATYAGRYDLWQYRSTGRVSGISGNVDMNLSYLGY